MKKVFYSIAIMSAMMLASCSEDRGKTYETADANNDEHVNPNHIRGYGENQTAASMESGSNEAWQLNAQRTSEQMAADLKLQPEVRNQVQQVLFERERRLDEIDQQYNYSATNRMGGQANNDTRNDANDNPSMQMDPSRPNNKGNAYTGSSNMSEEGEKLNKGGSTMDNGSAGNQQMNNQQMAGNSDQMNSERERIMADADRQLKGILTAEQYKQYAQNRASYAGVGRGDGGNANTTTRIAPNNSGDKTQGLHNSGALKKEGRSHLDKSGTDRMIREDNKFDRQDDGNN